jgi:nitroimidazol reductase NimA-like FMN-containing flavoprotein (pyridoxamine 5'-phosphate oxidase superfamily)
MSLSMSRPEREEFLAGVHVGVLSVAAGDGRGPLTVPVWYSYQPGGVVSVITGADSRKAQAIRAAGRFSLCAQNEQLPYRYVTVEGPAIFEEVTEAERGSAARRYLGDDQGDAWISANPGQGQIAIRMTPERWGSADFGQA